MSEKFVGATNTLLRGNKGVRKDKRFIKKKKRKNEGERRKKKGKQTLFWYYFELQKRLMNRKTKQRLMYATPAKYAK